MHRDPYRQYRRYARRAWRGRRDGYPVVFFGAGEPLSLIAAAAFARWAYRHRSAFLPFVIMSAAFITADIIHRHHSRYWLAVAAITAAVTVIAGIPHRLLWASPAGRFTATSITRAWEACGIDRPAERAYATAVIAVAGGWLAAAIAIGPAAKPLPAIAVIATLVLGIPWWAHRRRRARVRAARTMQAWPGLAENMGLPGSRIASVVVDAWGWTARVILRKGTTAAQAIDKLPAIESGLGLRPGSARAIPDAHRADRFTLRVIQTDPHAQPIAWPGPSVTSVTQPIEVGLFEDGRPVRVVILRRNVLIGGTTGSGKSGILNVILAALTACGDVVIWGVDLKGGMELQPWAQCLARLATTPEQAIELFRDAIRELDRRTAQMTARGARLWEPAPDMPALLIVVDEYAEMPPEAQDYADSLARRGRAVAVNLLAATQRPTQAAMGGGAVRSQMDVRICLRVRERRDVDLILGQGSFTAGWHAHALTQPGAFLLSTPEHTTPERARGYLINDGQVAHHAAQHADDRPVVDTSRTEGAPMAPESPQTPEPPTGHIAEPTAALRAAEGPEAALLAALRQAPAEGVPIWVLMGACNMSRSWVYYRLQEHAEAGRAVQTTRGSWRAVTPPSSGPGDGRPPSRPTTPRPPARRRRHGRRRPPGAHPR